MCKSNETYRESVHTTFKVHTFISNTNDVHIHRNKLLTGIYGDHEGSWWWKRIWNVYSNAFSKVCSLALPFTASWQTLHFKMHFVSWKSQNDWHCEWWRYSGKCDHVSDWIHYSLYLIRAIHFLFLAVCVHELPFSINSLWELLGRIVQGIVGLTAGKRVMRASESWEILNLSKWK